MGMKNISNVGTIEFDFPYTKTTETYPVTAYHPVADVLTVDLVVTSQSGCDDCYTIENRNEAWDLLNNHERIKVDQDIVNTFRQSRVERAMVDLIRSGR